jgi:RNA polymerase sigma factor (TIGR02999 family)
MMFGPILVHPGVRSSGVTVADSFEKPDVTQLLADWQRGDQEAFDRLVPLVYDELRRVARARLRTERDSHTLQTTALVHEAYVRLVDLNRMTLRNRTHFFAMASRLMREILIDHARRNNAHKRGGAAEIVSLDDVDPEAGGEAFDLLALDEALRQLDGVDPRLGQVVELRFFGGLSIAETAETLDVSPATVERDWVVAKAWLHQRLSSAP